MIKIGEYFRKTNETDVEAFEANIGWRMPEDYRGFLLGINGCVLDDSIIAIPALSDVADVRILYGLNVRDIYTGFDLRDRNSEWRDEIPDDCLLIGHDGGGNWFVLSGDSGAPGVYYTDHQHRYEKSSPENGNAYLIAPNFEAFLDRITVETN